MKKTIKIILLLICISMIISNIGVYGGWGVNKIKPSEPQGNAATTLKKMGNNSLGILQVVGVILSVSVIIIIGIKYMMGSVEEKAQYKKTLMPYVIGAAIVFSGSLIPQLIYIIVK